MSYDTSKLDQNLVAQARRGGKWDHNDQGRYDALLKAQQQKAKPAPQPTPKPQPVPQPKPSNPDEGRVYAGGSANFNEKTGKPFTSGERKPAVMPGPARQQAKKKAQVVKAQPKGTSIKNQQTQKVNQNNDINTNINGDNNKVFNEQDNSIRQYGGDNRSLVINEGGGKGKGDYYNSADKAITMANLSGFYDADDSPAAQAKFVDQQQTMNRDAQKKYSNVGITTSEKYAGFRGGDLNMKSLQQRIDSSGQRFRDRATIQEVKTYGDRAAKFSYQPFEFGDPIEEIKSNAGDIAKGYKDDIDDM